MGDDEALLRLGQRLRDGGYRFTTVTPATHARVNRRPGNEVARDLRDVFGWSRPFPPEVVPGELRELMRAAGVADEDGTLWRSRVRFSSYDDELFVHSAFPTDAPDSVFFGPDTYRMADAAIAYLAGREQPLTRAVDVGCGTGAGAIAVAKRAPDAQVLAVDINDTALRYARVNARLAGTGGVQPRRSDLLDDVDGELDLIISNPPFMVDPAGRVYRDGGGPDGNDLSLRIIDAAAKRLAPGGTLVLFSGTGITGGHDPLRQAAADRLAGTGLAWDYREVDPDVYGEELDGPAYGKADRIAVVVLTATRSLP
ncbi:SAM-dependent methyltransferase [Actinoplanes octamycinicus]|uniref:SAM-dependent methyltransferase n=1 Tax=Actinoplanes octamycinicus TaxID=135948 RepID=A0A7W7H3A7_9ACTN|nr:class I SAM-dependent methyltransferase [Actinoplanes octamycinicus]MBB4743184.1 SAM-dependent methyltransferase [Actinoplanes octamycinicus]GIE61253.1 SAM-dependent methyltransferase [Actinoplanes octamycinicus]